VVRGPETGGGTAVIAVPYPHLPPRAPEDSEGFHRLELVNRFPTFIEVDCRGDVHPGLASIESGEGKRWVLKLRDDLRFIDRTAVTAEDVVVCWEAAIARGAGVDSVRVLDARRMEVFLERAALRVLASLDLAVCRPSMVYDGMLPDSILAPGGGGSGNPRDELAHTALFLSADPTLAEYATGRGMAVHALPFCRTYVLLAPSRVKSIAAGKVPAALPYEAGRDLALAVRGARTRASETPPWWRDELDGCGPLAPTPESMTRDASAHDSIPVVYYDATDATARDLAERIVALATMDTLESEPARDLARCIPALRNGNAPVARGLAAHVLPDRMASGAGFGFVVGVPNPVPDSCGSARELLRRAPWLASGGARLADVVLPLVDASSYVILTNRHIAVTWDIYGNVRIVAPPAELP
jgi:hypothetical protein